MLLALLLLSCASFLIYWFFIKEDQIPQLPPFSGKRAIPPLQEFCEQNQNKTDRKLIKCNNPGTSEELCKPLPAMTPEEVRARVDAARAAQKDWGKTSFAQRRNFLKVLSEKILANKDSICKASAMDTGKTFTEATLGELLTSLEKIRYVRKYGEHYLKPESRTVPLFMLHKKAYLEYFPVGVVGAIIPWNYPFTNICGSLVATLMAGNGYVVKVSEWSTWSLVHCFEKIFHDALIECGFSPDIVQFVIGYGDSGESLIKAGVDHVFFIGSPETGKKVMRAAADTLAPVTLELGGKDPMIICEDAEFEQALDWAIASSFLNCAQNCVAGERIYVHEKIYDKFVEVVKQKCSNIRQGPTDTKSDCRTFTSVYDMGAMTMTGQIEKAEAMVEDAVKKGAKVIIGGKRNTSEECKNGQFFQATIICDLNENMRIVKEETFAPIMQIFKWKTEEEVIQMANATPYGLGAYVYSKDVKKAERMLGQIDAGVTMVNDWGVWYVVQDLPFGGNKHSGFGRFNGPEGLRSLCKTRSVVTDRFSFIRDYVPGIMKYPVSPMAHLIIWGGLEAVYAFSWKQKVNSVLGLAKLFIFGNKQKRD